MINTVIKLKTISMVTLVLALQSFCALASEELLYGSWKIQKIEYLSKDKTTAVNNPHLGVMMFTPTRYSVMYNPWKNERTPFAELSKPTDEEIKHAFQTMVFNTGSYSANKGVIATIADIARVPGFEGGKQFYRYSINKNTLDITMFDETYPNGDKPDWQGNLEIRFVLTKE